MARLSFQQRLGKYYARAEARQTVFDLIQALAVSGRAPKWLGKCQSSWDTPIPARFQHLLGTAWWDAQQVGVELRGYVVEHLDDRAAVLAVDETSLIKRGEESIRLQRQYSGLTGQIKNQVGVFLAYISSKGHSLLDRRLYLPKSWSAVPKRRKQSKVPSKVKFAIKTQLARQMLQSVFQTGMHPVWFVADEVYSREACYRHFDLSTRRQG